MQADKELAAGHRQHAHARLKPNKSVHSFRNCDGHLYRCFRPALDFKFKYIQVSWAFYILKFGSIVETRTHIDPIAHVKKIQILLCHAYCQTLQLQFSCTHGPVSLLLPLFCLCLLTQYSEVGIDDALVYNSQEEIFEMNNGCICCTGARRCQGQKDQED